MMVPWLDSDKLKVVQVEGEAGIFRNRESNVTVNI